MLQKIKSFAWLGVKTLFALFLAFMILELLSMVGLPNLTPFIFAPISSIKGLVSGSTKRAGEGA
jgi:hypothetical protein